MARGGWHLLSPKESVPLAQHALGLLAAALHDRFGDSRLFEEPIKLLRQPDDVEAVLARILPSGQLLFVSGQLAAFVQRQLAESLPLESGS